MSSDPGHSVVKILHIGKYFPPYAGGMETYLRDLMCAQKRQGHTPTALVHRSEASLFSVEEEYQSNDQQLKVTRAAVWLRILFTPFSPTFALLLHKRIKQDQPDILHMHMPNVSVFWALFLPSARKIPWVIHWHADVLASEHSRGLRAFYHLYRPFERAVLRHSKVIIATSPPYLETSKPLADFREKCHVVPLGLDPASQPAPQSKKPASHPTRPLRVLAVGRLTYYKGFEHLIRAVAECQNVEVHLVGKGDQEAKLKALSAELSLDERVTFHGHITPAELADQFNTCDCLCLPSIERTEAFGMVLLEAMSHGKATIVSDVPGSGMSWVVDNNITGIHTPPESGANLAMCLQNLRDDRATLLRLGIRGKEQFDRLFHISRSANRLEKLYATASTTKNET